VRAEACAGWNAERSPSCRAAGRPSQCERLADDAKQTLDSTLRSGAVPIEGVTCAFGACAGARAPGPNGKGQLLWLASSERYSPRLVLVFAFGWDADPGDEVEQAQRIAASATLEAEADAGS
jgi:hypothetical protein